MEGGDGMCERCVHSATPSAEQEEAPGVYIIYCLIRGRRPEMLPSKAYRFVEYLFVCSFPILLWGGLLATPATLPAQGLSSAADLE